MKKAARIVAIISLILDYLIMIGLLGFGIYLLLNANAVVGNMVSDAMTASSSSGAIASSGANGDAGRAIGGVVVAFGGALAVMIAVAFSLVFGVAMLFPIITMHVALRKLKTATCRGDMLAVSIVAIFAIQPIAAIMFLAIPNEGYSAQ